MSKLNKLKTHKGAKKRFRITGKGHVKRKRCGTSHLLSNKSGKRLRYLRKPVLCSGADERRLKQLMRET